MAPPAPPALGEKGELPRDLVASDGKLHRLREFAATIAHKLSITPQSSIGTADVEGFAAGGQVGLSRHATFVVPDVEREACGTYGRRVTPSRADEDKGPVSFIAVDNSLNTPLEIRRSEERTREDEDDGVPPDDDSGSGSQRPWEEGTWSRRTKSSVRIASVWRTSVWDPFRRFCDSSFPDKHQEAAFQHEVSLFYITVG